MPCPHCGAPTASMPHPFAFLNDIPPTLRYCGACLWERADNGHPSAGRVVPAGQDGRSHGHGHTEGGYVA